MLTGHVVDIEPSFGNGGIGVVELDRKRLDLADSPVKRADGMGLAALSDPTWLSLICRKVSWLGSAAGAHAMIDTLLVKVIHCCLPMFGGLDT